MRAQDPVELMQVVGCLNLLTRHIAVPLPPNSLLFYDFDILEKLRFFRILANYFLFIPREGGRGGGVGREVRGSVRDGPRVEHTHVVSPAAPAPTDRHCNNVSQSGTSLRQEVSLSAESHPPQALGN